MQELNKNDQNKNELGLGKFDFKSHDITQFNLDTPLHQILPMEEFSEDFLKNASEDDKNNPSATPRKANGANSLFTTTSDYAKFSAAWMNDSSQEMQAAFEPAVTMENDDWAIRQNVPKEDRENLGWGLGWGLQHYL